MEYDLQILLMLIGEKDYQIVVLEREKQDLLRQIVELKKNGKLEQSNSGQPPR